MAKKQPNEYAYISYGELKIPVAIFFEKRRNTRISIGVSTINLRLSGNLSRDELNDQINWVEKWLYRRFEKAPSLLARFLQVRFEDEDRVIAMGETYVLHLKESEKKTSTATLSEKDIYITLAKDLSDAARPKSIQSLVHKLWSQVYQPAISKRVAELNERHFQQEYQLVSIKYIHSKWGSCNSNGQLIFSSKLLLCPSWVRDYVIIHELAHLVELNHSPDFWALVKRVMPKYDRAEKWLDEQGVAIDIQALRNPVPFTRTTPTQIKPPTDIELNDPSIESKNNILTPIDKTPQRPLVANGQLELIPIDFTDAPNTQPPTKRKRRMKKDNKDANKNSGEQLRLF